MNRHNMLIPLDGSQRAEAALPYAVTLARAQGVGLELVAVVDDVGQGADAERLKALVAEGLRAYLHSVAERLREEGLAVETAVREGNPVDVILARAEHASAVVMTTRGLGGVDRWLIGSVADKVLRLAPCPVLAVRPSEPVGGELWPWRPRRLLVPLDGSPLAEQALPLAYRWAAALAAEVVLARVEPWTATQIAAYNGYPVDVAAIDETVTRAAAEYLEGQRRQAPSELVVRTEVLRGGPAHRLIEFAKDEQVDLVVMTSHGRGGIRRLIFGSVADRIVRAGVPVCIVHPVRPEDLTTPEREDVTASR